MHDNFELLADGLDVQPLIDLLGANPELWNAITVRQEFTGTAHHDTECIFVLGPREFTPEAYFGELDALDYPAVHVLMPALLPVLKPVFDQLGITELGRILIVRLKAGGVIDEHIDEGRYAEHFSRFHVVLTATEYSELTVGGETQFMQPGETWWFNHRKPHSGSNIGTAPRIHLIFDAVTPRYKVHVS